MNTIFISYSHKDEEWKDRLKPFLVALENADLKLHVWDDRKIDAGAEWYPGIEGAIKDSVAAVLLITANFLASPFCIKQEVSRLLQRREEAGMLLIPILISPCPWKAHRWLTAIQMLPRDSKCIELDYRGNKYKEIFTAAADAILDHLERREKRAATKAITRGVAEPAIKSVLKGASTLASEAFRSLVIPGFPPLPAGSIELSHLPETGRELFGRDKELDLLDAAWGNDATTPPGTKVIAFIARGGTGKSSLVNNWLHDMERDNYRGATKIFGWSFYSQGARCEGMTSADTFISAALKFFGGDEGASLANSPASAWDKGEHLAKYIAADRTLLILDGMEPLQSPHDFERGKLRDPALDTLLRCLAKASKGLCIVTSREPLFDIDTLPGVAAHDIDQITPQAGRALLRTMRVIGTDEELEHLAKKFGPHALTIALLGVYIHETDPAHKIKAAETLASLPGEKPLDKVLAGFERWLGKSAEAEMLHLLGLFDRPIDKGCMDALTEKPAILGLTERIAAMNGADRERMTAKLERLQMLKIRRRDTVAPVIDAHPLLREYFGKKLSAANPEAWKEANRRLYTYLTESTVDKESPTLEELQPLYQAVVHGVRAGLVEEARAKVYRNRINKGTSSKGFYATKKLGAFGADLGAVACFFEEPWKKVSAALTEDDQAWLLNVAAYHLRALGRLNKAVEPMRAGLEMLIDQEDWTNAAISSSNLSELELTLGRIDSAVEGGRRSVEFAYRSGDAFWKMGSRATHADALHQSGKKDAARALFAEAEKMQVERQPGYLLLYSMRGFRYCDLLLSNTERIAWRQRQERIHSTSGEKLTSIENEIIVCQEVDERAKQTILIHERNHWLLDIALDHLTLGRANLYLSLLNPTDTSHRQSALTHTKAAADGLRASGNQHHLPRGLLTHALLRHTLLNDPAGSAADLDEAQRIAERGGMQLHLADVHLHRGRLFSDKTEIAKARAIIEKCGYWRRKEELEDAEGWVG